MLRPVSGEVVESFLDRRRIDDNEIAAGPHLDPDQHQIDAFGMIQLQQPIQQLSVLSYLRTLTTWHCPHSPPRQINTMKMMKFARHSINISPNCYDTIRYETLF